MAILMCLGAHTHRPVCTRLHTRDAITHVCTCGVRVLSPTRSKASLAMRGHGTYMCCNTMEWFRGRENSPDLPQVPARRMSR